MLLVPSGGVGSAVAVGSATVFTVPSAVAVGDVVYLTGVDTADRADNTSFSTMPAAALVINKPTSTTADLLYLGESGLFTGLTAGATHFVDTLGGITATPPTAVGSVIQPIGEAINTTILLFRAGDVILL